MAGSLADRIKAAMPQGGFLQAPQGGSVGSQIARAAYASPQAPQPGLTRATPMQSQAPMQQGIAALPAGNMAGMSQMELAKMIRTGTPEQKAAAMAQLKGGTGQGGAGGLMNPLQVLMNQMMGIKTPRQPTGPAPSGVSGLTNFMMR